MSYRVSREISDDAKNNTTVTPTGSNKCQMLYDKQDIIGIVNCRLTFESEHDAGDVTDQVPVRQQLRRFSGVYEWHRFTIEMLVTR